MRFQYYVLTLMLFLLASCSETGSAGDPGPVLTQEPTLLAHRVAVQEPEVDMSGSAGLPATTCATAVIEDTAAFAAEVIRLVNAERTRSELKALVAQSQLTDAAQVHALDMACNLFVSHTGSDGSDPFVRITRLGYSFSTAAENVAAGYATPTEVVNGWMNSDGHRANIMNPSFTDAGAGYVYSSATNTSGNYHYYWAMSFGAP